MRVAVSLHSHWQMRKSGFEVPGWTALASCAVLFAASLSCADAISCRPKQAAAFQCSSALLHRSRMGQGAEVHSSKAWHLAPQQPRIMPTHKSVIDRAPQLCSRARLVRMQVSPADEDCRDDLGSKARRRETGREGLRIPFGRFENLDISEQSRARLAALKLDTLSLIQRKTFQPIMEGRDIIAKAPTGTGKTLAYSLPVVERLLAMPTSARTSARPSCLVLVPTRELAQQVNKELSSIAGKRLAMLLAVGGVAMDPQIDALQRGSDVVVATPGRAVDLLRARRMALYDLKMLVLDEADQMLEAGFAQELDYVWDAVPRDVKLQTLMFCATLPRRMLETAERICHHPLRIELSKQEVDFDMQAPMHDAEGDGAGALEKDEDLLSAGGSKGVAGEQRGSKILHKAMRAAAAARPAIIADVLAVDTPRKTIIFTNTKLETVTLAAELGGKVAAAGGPGDMGSCLVLHGDLPQFQRTRVMDDFKRCAQGVLIATDVAARGIHIQDLDLVIHCGVPLSTSGAARRAKTSKAEVVNSEQFIHRTGRTGRMGAGGTSILLFDPTAGEAALLPVLERVIGGTFEFADAPQVGARLRAAGNLAKRRISAVPDEAARLFEQDAQALLDEHGPLALARALAALGGLAQPLAPRSLLDGRDGVVTICAHPRTTQVQEHAEGGNGEVRAVTPSDVTEELRERLGVKKIGRVSLCADGSAVVDLPEPQAQVLLTGPPPSSSAISRFSAPEALPRLKGGKQ